MRVMSESCYNETLSPDTDSLHSLHLQPPADWTRWAGAILGSVLVGLSGVLPLFLLPGKLGGSVTDENLKYMLGFAVGGLLGDVFLHLLPETYQHVCRTSWPNEGWSCNMLCFRCLITRRRTDTPG